MAAHLENALCVGRHGRVQRGAPHVVLYVGVRAGLQQALGRVGARVAGGQVQGGLAGAVRLVVQAGARRNSLISIPRLLQASERTAISR